ncbi:hypothetical protein RND71_036392 [Anisodus tanguticus]|uniref:Uncharacterized protein n=1 Tax=Anisodus tanguticus TaxID=243964 RepID=A0AAE1USP9_9SOLA|nr:hypothetical protein RND71_036392 [Anisodus tanguticus]
MGMIFYHGLFQFGLVHISTGDFLRAELSAGTDIGNKAKEYMNSDMGTMIFLESLSSIARKKDKKVIAT